MAKKKVSKSRKYLYLIIALLIAAGVLGYYYRLSKLAEVNSQPTYQESIVTRGDLTVSMTGDGNASIAVTNLSFEVSGEITEILVEPGDTVHAGDIVARLDDTDYANRLTSAQQTYELSLINAQKNLDDLKAEIESLEADYDIMLQIPDIYTAKEISDQKTACDQARTNYETQQRILNLTMASAQTDVKTAEDELSNTVLISPVNARVLGVEYSAGETIEENSTCIILQDDSNIKVVCSVSEVDITSVSVGQTVEAIFDAYEDEVFTGVVSFIDSISTMDSSGIVSYEVEAELDQGRDKIKDGMTCTVEFIEKQVKDVLYVPIEAVQMIDGKQTVEVKNEDGTTSSREIKTGFADDDNVEVTEGLDLGETVMVMSTRTSAASSSTTEDTSRIENNAMPMGMPMGRGPGM